jgi:hypothetical protein
MQDNYLVVKEKNVVILLLKINKYGRMTSHMLRQKKEQVTTLQQ